jgi:hypothetical protein
MRQAYDHVYSIPIHIDILPNIGFQAALVTAIRRTRTGPWHALLQRRLCRWIPDLTNDMFRLTVHNLHEAFCTLPASVVFDSLRLLLNGWTTSARMSNAIAACPLCAAVECDRIEHIMHCPTLSTVANEQLPLLASSEGPVLRPRVLCLAFFPDPALRAHAVMFSSAAYFTYNLCRHVQGTVPSEIFKARLRHLRVLHPSLRNLQRGNV